MATNSYLRSAKKSSNRITRTRREFVPLNLHSSSMERRLLPGAVFFRDPNSTFGTNQVISDSTVYAYDDVNRTQPHEQKNTVNSDGGPGTTSTFSNEVVRGATVTESGITTSQALMPIAGATQSGSQTFSFAGSFQNTTKVSTGSGGPYNIVAGPIPSGTPAEQYSSLHSTSPFNMVVKNVDGTPATGTMTISFSVTISASAASRFSRIGTIDIETNYLTIKTIGTGGGIYVTSPNGLLKSDPQFANGNGPGNTTFNYTGVFPVKPTATVSYGTSLASGPWGQFGATGPETVSQIDAMSYTFSMTTSN